MDLSAAIVVHPCLRKEPLFGGDSSVKPNCSICGAPSVQYCDDWLLCETCTARSEEYKINAALLDTGRSGWNTSLHDPWWRAWLTSNELYSTIRQHLPKVAIQRGSLLDGDLYDYDSGHSCHIEAWISIDGIIIAYPFASGTTIMERYDTADFQLWIAELYDTESLQLGSVQFSRDMMVSSYGAKRPTQGASTPTIMWSQAGDWAAMFWNWHFAGSPR